MLKKTHLFAIIFICLIITCAWSTAGIIVIKSKGDVPTYELAFEGFRSVVKDEIVEFDMDANPKKGKKIAKEIKKLRRKKDFSAILAIGHMAAKLARDEITDIPVIFCMVVNPVKSNLAGRDNFGGVSFDLSAESQLARLREVVPDAKNVGVLYDPKNSSILIKNAKEVAPACC